MIRVSGLDVRFGRGHNAVHALRHVSFQVAKGESFGLVGESGSGKSTVLRAITGLIKDWSGGIEIAGETQGHKRTKAFRRQVQMIFQDPYGSLHPRHTVDQILREPLEIHRLGGADARVVRALEEVGLDTSFRFRFPHQLSGGQRQRIAVARSLIVEPKVLLLDEPTSALDVSIQAEVLNLLMRLRREHGLTYVLVSHNLAVVSHMCERLAVMRSGEIIETLTVDQLRAGTPDHPYTSQLFRAAYGYDRDLVAELVDDL
ncbi:MAG: ABC transporter ATP-binding protein [Rhodospirillaceae bacterium]|nr:ABC transporter ATP-binding protein [Rhodospirillaceae bacterium]